MTCRAEEILGSSWTVLVDGNHTDSLESLRYRLCELGTLKTIVDFWSFWNSFGGENDLLERLPQTCNIRMFRSIVNTANPVNDLYLRWGGKWIIDCAPQDIARAFFMLLIAGATENVSENCIGIVLSKNQKEFTITVWTKQFDASDEMNLKMILGSTCEDSVYERLRGPDENDPPDEIISLRIPASGPRKKIKMKEFKLLQNHESALIMPKSLENFKWSDIFKSSSGKDSSRPAVVDPKYSSVVDTLVAEYNPYFDFEVVPDLNPARQQLLNAEGCVVCGKQFVSEYEGKYMILRCKLLHCQHVIVLDDLQEKNINVLKKYHCTSFFDVYRVNQDDPSMSPFPRDPLGTKRQCALRLQVCHLLNDKMLLDLAFGQENHLSTLQDTRSGVEFLQVSLPDPTNDGLVQTAKDAGNYPGVNYFKILRARFVVSVKDHLTGYVHDANFDLTSNVSNGACFKLRHEDQQSGNSVTIGLVRTHIKGEGDVNVIKFVRYDFNADARALAKDASHGPQRHYVHIPSHAPMTMSPTTGSREPPNFPNSPHDFNDNHGRPNEAPVVMRSKGYPRGGPPRHLGPPPDSVAHAKLSESSGGMPPNHRLVCRTPPSPSDLYTNPYHQSQRSPHQSFHGSHGYPPHLSIDHPTMGPPPNHRSPRSPASRSEHLPPSYHHRDLQHEEHTMERMVARHQASPRGYEHVMDPNSAERPPPHSPHRSRHPSMGYSPHGPPPGHHGPPAHSPPGHGHAGPHPASPNRGSHSSPHPHSPHAQNAAMRKGSYGPGRGMGGPGYNTSFPQVNDRAEEDENAISHLIGRVVYLAKSESGSRFVQEKVGNPRYLKVFFQEMKKRLPELMTDNFGHYAVETLFTHCSSNQRITLLQNLGPSLPNVACHKQGSFSVQSLINAISSKEEILLMKDYLKRELHRIILSCPGHYVILRFITRFGWPCSDFVSDLLASNVVGFATDHYGLRVMKATFDSASPGAKLEKNREGAHNGQRRLFDAVVEHTNSLAENQYGNYIIQHLFDIGSPSTTDQVKQKMVGRYVRYSKQKFSSNVVEKCLKHSAQEYSKDRNWSSQIVQELLGSAKELISDKYGNYCLQTALSTIADNPQLVIEFIVTVKPHLEGLRVNVRNKWGKLLAVAQQSANSHIVVESTAV